MTEHTLEQRVFSPTDVTDLATAQMFLGGGSNSDPASSLTSESVTSENVGELL